LGWDSAPPLEDSASDIAQEGEGESKKKKEKGLGKTKGKEAFEEGNGETLPVPSIRSLHHLRDQEGRGKY